MKRYIKSSISYDTIVQIMLEDARSYIGDDSTDFLDNIFLQFDGEEYMAIDDVIRYNASFNKYADMNLADKFVKAYINADKC